MTQGEFQTEFDRMLKTYGTQAYPAERISLIYAEVGSLPATSFKAIVSRMIGEHPNHKPPMIPQIREEVSRERERLWGQQKRNRIDRSPKPGSECPLCLDSGTVRARAAGEGQIYAFKCDCEAGRADRRSFPAWSNFHGVGWEVVA